MEAFLGIVARYLIQKTDNRDARSELSEAYNLAKAEWAGLQERLNALDEFAKVQAAINNGMDPNP